MRAALDHAYLEAHRAGHAEVALGRSADFYGPRVLISSLGATFFPAVLTGDPALGHGLRATLDWYDAFVAAQSDRP